MAQVFSSDLFRLGVVLAALFASSLAAPAVPEDPWWYHPCNADLARIRHGRSATDPLVAIKRQLRIFVDQLNDSIKKINALYKNHVSATGLKSGKLKWLKFGKMFKSLKKAANTNMLPVFHASLQKFAGTLQVLHDKRIETTATHFDEAQRKTIYRNISFHMRNLLCEVKESTKSELKNVSLAEMKIQLKKTLDLTSVHMLDMNFFKKTRSFFLRSQRLLNKKRKRRKNSAVKPKRT